MLRTRVDAGGWRGFARYVAIFLLPVVLAACAAEVRNPAPLAIADTAMVLGSTPVRYWGDRALPNTNELVREKWAQTKAARPELLKKGSRPQISFLAISGGGSDGAFGAGLLVGWSASGKRPEFDIVTGVSTGALAAPFAFLGPKHDRSLKAVYTEYSTRDLLRKHPLRGLVGGQSLASNKPLAGVIAAYVDRAFLDEIAREHARGRRLLIGTTNLDAQRPVIWDMGQIALSMDPRAVELFRNVLLASAAIPGLFPPVYVQVNADGKVYQEMHVDGGTTNQVFLLPNQMKAAGIDAKLRIRPRRRVYIIRNGRVGPEFEIVKASTLSIAGRSISTLIKTQGVGDLYQIYDLTRRNGIDYNLAYIPGEFSNSSSEPFDKAYMSKLYNLGYELGRKGYVWRKKPPQS
jgi:predicted patatin/cPLA2 family phospholipase